MKQIRFLALAVALTTLSACQTMDDLAHEIKMLELPSLASMSESNTDNLIYEGRCPEIQIVKDLRALSEFSNMESSDENQLISRVTLTNLKSACRNDESTVTVDLKMAFDGILGPMGRAGTGDKPLYSYPFFVAVADRGGDILAKEIFSANLTYPPGNNHQTYYENMRQIIPLDRYNKATSYKILIGFQLGPDQLDYNRSDLGKQMHEAQIVRFGGTVEKSVLSVLDSDSGASPGKAPADITSAP